MSKERVLELLKTEVIASVNIQSKELLTLVFSSQEHEITTSELQRLLETEELHRENHFFLKGFFANFSKPGLWIEFHLVPPREKMN